MKRLTIATALLLAVGATSVHAADTFPSAGEAPAEKWQGFYAGAWLGYHWGNIENTYCNGICGDDLDLSGAVGGVEVGYNFVVDQNWVLGVFANVPLLKPQEDADVPIFGTYDIDPRWAAYTGVKIGRAYGQWMPYGLVGLGVARVKVTDPVGTSSSATHLSGVVGAGVEYMFADNWSLDGRFVYSFSNEKDYDFCTGGFSCPSGYKENAPNVTIGLNYQF
ncbi:outer membrane beta-barrel protein [Nitratireductor aquimarinus]|uniref:outer membrane protein n=1 Tax=Nitratireductor aquimarinus TaxID=889300 RepID=UPI002935A639|nr:outer membrane beta-barrel protein [Nitratireductor aquimarinus]MDV2967444.1 outer membrane beta-barrel protein [Nitratireductor aquimarinus]